MQETERRGIHVHVAYINGNTEQPQIRIYTSEALKLVLPETFEEWDQRGETVYTAELWRTRTEVKYPAGFHFKVDIACEAPELHSLVEFMPRLYGPEFGEFLKWCWQRTTPGLPVKNDFPLCFPVK